MNIFILSYCARYYCNSHIVKMPCEGCQLLCSAHHIYNNGIYKPRYKLTHAQFGQEKVWKITCGYVNLLKLYVLNTRLDMKDDMHAKMLLMN